MEGLPDANKFDVDVDAERILVLRTFSPANAVRAGVQVVCEGNLLAVVRG